MITHYCFESALFVYWWCEENLISRSGPLAWLLLHRRLRAELGSLFWRSHATSSPGPLSSSRPAGSSRDTFLRVLCHLQHHHIHYNIQTQKTHVSVSYTIYYCMTILTSIGHLSTPILLPKCLKPPDVWLDYWVWKPESTTRDPLQLGEGPCKGLPWALWKQCGSMSKLWNTTIYLCDMSHVRYHQ